MEGGGDGGQEVHEFGIDVKKKKMRKREWNGKKKH